MNETEPVLPYKPPLHIRLVHTIRQLEAETESGAEDWTPLVERLRQHLAEIQTSLSPAKPKKRKNKRTRNRTAEA